MRSAAGLVLAMGLAACATPPPPEPPAPKTLSDAAFKPMLTAAFTSNKRVEWEPAAAALLARTDLTDAQRAQVYFARRINRGVWVESGTVATPQCAVMDIDRGLALMPEGPAAEAAKRDRLYQLSRDRFFTAPGNCD
jgi:lipoprotein NlpI